MTRKQWTKVWRKFDAWYRQCDRSYKYPEWRTQRAAIEKFYAEVVGER